jgi:hypothetical protein
MSSQTDLVEQSPLLTPLSILPRTEMHQASSSTSRFDLSAVAERLPRTQTHTPIDNVTGAKINEGFKNLTRNFRRDFSLRGFGRDNAKEGRDVPRDPSMDKA